MNNCIFCKIVEGKAPCYKIYEDEKFMAFLDIFPIVEGQIIIIPKKHEPEYFFNLNDEDYMELMRLSKEIAKAIDKSVKPIKTGMIVEGFELGHVHVKLFPLNEGFHLGKSILKFSEEEMKSIAEKIKEKI
ncbi:MAG: HIT domain-containing protein [Candidatus Pacearchaeota archaeon]|nr:HIT domain-containing protein [Candidatus Pacearchaeota archaeon]